MSDDEHDVETFESADAGASHTVPMQAGSVRKGGFMVRRRRATEDATRCAIARRRGGRRARRSDDDAPDAGKGSGLITDQPAPQAAAPKGAFVEEQKEVAVDWADVANKLPWGKDKASTKKRKQLFRSFDPNGNG